MTAHHRYDARTDAYQVERSNVCSRSPIWYTYFRATSLETGRLVRHSLTIQVRHVVVVGIHLPRIAFVSRPS